MHIEKRVDFSEFVQLPDSFGTADAIVVDDRAGELVLIDLKTGHTPVVVEENSQLMLYALGVLAMLADGDQVPVGPAPKDEEECDLVCRPLPETHERAVSTPFGSASLNRTGTPTA